MATTTPEKDDDKVEFEIEGDAPAEKEAPAAEKTAAADTQIDVVDDTPEADRGRQPLPEHLLKDPTEDELKSYSEDVKKRIKLFTKGYHDERRAKEAAARERDEALRVAQAVVEENKKLKGSLSEGQTALFATTKAAIDAEVEAAKRAYKEAYETFDPDAIAEAQEKLMAAKIKQENLANFKPSAGQDEKKGVQPVASAPAQPSAAQPDPKALAWHQRNPWFGADREMTSFTLGLHEKLVLEDRLDPRSDEYYQRLESRLRQVFPEKFGDASEKEKPAAKPSVVAPASRSTAPKKIVLTQTQVQLAKKLGVPLELYAKQVALEQRKEQQNG